MQIKPVKENSGNSNGSAFSLHSVPSSRLLFFSDPPPQEAASPQDLVSRGLAAISPVTALRATRMWLSETVHVALPDVYIATAV